MPNTAAPLLRIGGSGGRSGASAMRSRSSLIATSPSKAPGRPISFQGGADSCGRDRAGDGLRSGGLRSGECQRSAAGWCSGGRALAPSRPPANAGAGSVIRAHLGAYFNGPVASGSRSLTCPLQRYALTLLETRTRSPSPRSAQPFDAQSEGPRLRAVHLPLGFLNNSGPLQNHKNLSAANSKDCRHIGLDAPAGCRLRKDRHLTLGSTSANRFGPSLRSEPPALRGAGTILDHLRTLVALEFRVRAILPPCFAHKNGNQGKMAIMVCLLGNNGASMGLPFGA